MEYELTPEAIELGLGVALPAVLDLGQKREFGRGERARASATRQIRGCRVTMGGHRGPVDLFLTA